MRAPYSNYIARLSVASFGVIPFVDQRTVLPTLGGLLFEISELLKLTSITLDNIIVVTVKSTLARHRIPEVPRRDNGPSM